jgi:Ribbon-helix-helix domain
MSAGAADRPRRKFLDVKIKRSVKIGEQRTSVWVEDAFWNALKDIAASPCQSLVGSPAIRARLLPE